MADSPEFRANGWLVFPDKAASLVRSYALCSREKCKWTALCKRTVYISLERACEVQQCVGRCKRKLTMAAASNFNTMILFKCRTPKKVVLFSAFVSASMWNQSSMSFWHERNKCFDFIYSPITVAPVFLACLFCQRPHSFVWALCDVLSCSCSTMTDISFSALEAKLPWVQPGKISEAGNSFPLSQRVQDFLLA